MLSESDAENYYFRDDEGKDINSLGGLFAWQAHDFYHVNPYKYGSFWVVQRPYFQQDVHELGYEDLYYDERGRRVRPDINHPVECGVSCILIQQRIQDGRIVVSSNWLYPDDCYSAVAPFGEAVYNAMYEEVGGDQKRFEDLYERYEEFNRRYNRKFRTHLHLDYFKGRKLRGRCWSEGYVFAASRPWKIKTLEEFDAAQKVEEEHFSTVLEKFIAWLRRGGIRLGKGAKEVLRAKVRKIYVGYPCWVARDMCKDLVEEDKKEPSDVYLWWGGEPNFDGCYALLALCFEIYPYDIGTIGSRERIARNLKALIDLIEKRHSRPREIEAEAWRAIFSDQEPPPHQPRLTKYLKDNTSGPDSEG